MVVWGPDTILEPAQQINQKNRKLKIYTIDATKF